MATPLNSFLIETSPHIQTSLQRMDDESIELIIFENSKICAIVSIRKKLILGVPLSCHIVRLDILLILKSFCLFSVRGKLFELSCLS